MQQEKKAKNMALVAGTLQTLSNLFFLSMSMVGSYWRPRFSKPKRLPWLLLCRSDEIAERVRNDANVAGDNVARRLWRRRRWRRTATAAVRRYKTFFLLLQNKLERLSKKVDNLKKYYCTVLYYKYCTMLYCTLNALIFSLHNSQGTYRVKVDPWKIYLYLV